MEVKFEMYSDALPNRAHPEQVAVLRVTVDVQCRDKKGADATWELVGIENTSDADSEVLFEHLPAAEQAKLESRADRAADDAACDAWQDWYEGEIDRAYDRMRDGDL